METSEIKSVVEAGLARVNERLDRQDAKILQVQQKSLGGGGLMNAGLGGLLAKLAGDPQIQQLRDGHTKQILIKSDAGLASLIKSTVTGDGSQSDGASPQALRLNVFGEDPRRRLSVLDAMPRLPIMSGSFEYERLDGYVNAADNQSAESEAKEEAADLARYACTMR